MQSGQVNPGPQTNGPTQSAPANQSRRSRTLLGQRVVVTRARDQAAELTQPLLERGAVVLEIPVIKFAPPTQLDYLKDALEGLGEYDWLVFTSVNGVKAFFDYFFQTFEDLRDIGAVRIAAVGPATAAKIREFHLKVDVMPTDHVGAKIAGAIAKYQSIQNVKICLLRAEGANPELPRALEALGAIVDDIPCYRTVMETDDPNGTAMQLLEKGADWVTFTSGSPVQFFNARFDLAQLVKRFPQLKFASIGPETTHALTALGFTPTVEAKKHTVEGLVAALERHVRASA